MKKNKEKFTQSISQQNLQAINNLGTLASQIINNGNTLLTIDDLQINVGGTPTRLSDWIVSKNSAIQVKLDSIDSAIETNLTNSDSILNTAIKNNLTNSNSILKTAIKTNLTNSDSTLQVLKSDYEYFKKLMRNHTHDYKMNYPVGAFGGSISAYRNKKPIVMLNNKKRSSCNNAAFSLSDTSLYNYYKDETIEFQNDESSNLAQNLGNSLCKITNVDGDKDNFISN